MAHTSIHSAAAKPDFNPATLFQAAPNPEPSSDGGFEAALNRAREPERQETPQAAQSRQNERAGETSRSAEARPPQADKPAEAAPEREAGTDAATSPESTAQAQAPAGESGKPASTDEETPAALPAEIAAILAALAAATGRSTVTLDGEAPEVAGGSLLTDAGKGKGGNSGSNAQSFLMTTAKDAGEQPIALNTRETVVQQAVTLATQSAPNRNFADQVLAGLRGEAVNGVQGAGLPFSARGEPSQQVAQLTQLQVSTPAGQRGWATEIGNQVSWMLGRNESKAELVLTPPSLGKLGVSIHVNGDQTTAHFVAATQAARDALEQAMPRLREVLQQAGINLGQTNVSTSGEQRPHDGGGDSGQRGGWGSSGRSDAGDMASTGASTTTSWVRSGNGVIDTFA